jgi:hypothetical protein
VEIKEKDLIDELIEERMRINPQYLDILDEAEKARTVTRVDKD